MAACFKCSKQVGNDAVSMENGLTCCPSCYQTFFMPKQRPRRISINLGGILIPVVLLGLCTVSYLVYRSHRKSIVEAKYLELEKTKLEIQRERERMIESNRREKVKNEERRYKQECRRKQTELLKVKRVQRLIIKERETRLAKERQRLQKERQKLLLTKERQKLLLTKERIKKAEEMARIIEKEKPNVLANELREKEIDRLGQQAKQKRAIILKIQNALEKKGVECKQLEARTRRAEEEEKILREKLRQIPEDYRIASRDNTRNHTSNHRGVVISRNHEDERNKIRTKIKFKNMEVSRTKHVLMDALNEKTNMSCILEHENVVLGNLNRQLEQLGAPIVRLTDSISLGTTVIYELKDGRKIHALSSIKSNGVISIKTTDGIVKVKEDEVKATTRHRRPTNTRASNPRHSTRSLRPSSRF